MPRNAAYFGVPRAGYQGPVFGVQNQTRAYVPSGGVELGARLARESARAADAFGAMADREAERLGLQEGARYGAVLTPGARIELQDYATIRGEAFNRAALQSALATADASSYREITRIAGEHPYDAAGFDQAVERYIEGLTRPIAEVAPEHVATFQQQLRIRSEPFRARIQALAVETATDRADAAAIEAEEEFERQLDDLAPDLFSADPAISGAAVVAVNAMREQYMARFDEVGPDGAPLYTETERAEAQRAFFLTVIEEGATQWAIRSYDPAEALALLDRGELFLNIAGDETEGRIDIAAELDDEADGRMRSALTREITRRNAAMQGAETAATEQERARRSAAEAEAWARFYGVEGTAPITPTEVVDLHLGPEATRQLLAAIEQRLVAPPTVTPPDLVRQFSDMMFFERTDPREWIRANAAAFAPDDYRSFMEKAAQIWDDDSELSARRRQRAETLRAALGGSDAALAFLDDGAKQRIAGAINEYWDRVLAGEDVGAVYDDVLKRSAPAVSLGAGTPPVPRPRFTVEAPDGSMDFNATAAAINAAREAGTITQDEWRRQSEALMLWFEYQSRRPVQ